MGTWVGAWVGAWVGVLVVVFPRVSVFVCVPACVGGLAASVLRVPLRDRHRSLLILCGNACGCVQLDVLQRAMRLGAGFRAGIEYLSVRASDPSLPTPLAPLPPLSPPSPPPSSLAKVWPVDVSTIPQSRLSCLHPTLHSIIIIPPPLHSSTTPLCWGVCRLPENSSQSISLQRTTPVCLRSPFHPTQQSVNQSTVCACVHPF